MLTKRDSTGTLVERWPDYHKHTPADDGFVEDGPHIDAWETRIIPDQVAAKAAFLAGDLDIFTTVDPLELPEFEGQDHLNIVEIPGGGRAMQGMDGGKFHDKRSRMALQKAFDYEGFIAAIRPLGGQYAAPISDLLPAYQKLGQEDLKEWFRYDPAEAQKLWQAAEFEVPVDNIKIFQSSGSPLQHEISDYVAQSLATALGPLASPPRSRPLTAIPGRPARSTVRRTSRTGSSSVTARAIGGARRASPTTRTSSTTTRGPTASTRSTTSSSRPARRSPRTRRRSSTC